MTPVTALRRHPFLSLTSLVLVSAALWIGYFLATFDLDRYRDQIAGELGSRLHMPVQLGAARVEMREAGIAFRFDDLRIGTPQTRTQLSAARLWLQLAWHGLLLGKPVLTEVALDAPHLRITPPAEPTPDEAGGPGEFRFETLSNLQVRRVEIQQGSLEVGWRYLSGAERGLSLQDITVEIADAGAGHTAVFDATGSLPGRDQPTRLALKGSIDLPAAGGLQDVGWDLLLNARGLDAAQLTGLLPDQPGVNAAGAGELTLTTRGKIADGLTFSAELSGTKLNLHPKQAPFDRGVSFHHLALAGTWRKSGADHHLRDFTVKLDDLLLNGNLSLHPEATGYRIDVQLGTSVIPLDTLRPWLPAEAPGNFWLSKLQTGGTLALQLAAFQATIPTSGEASASISLDSLDGRLSDLSWSMPRDRIVRLHALAFHYADSRWQFEQGSAAIAELPVTFSGSVSQPAGAEPHIALALESRASAPQWLALWPTPLPAELALEGELAVQGQLSGTLQQMVVAVRADLAALAVRYGDQFQLPAGGGAFLTVQGQVAENVLTIGGSNLTMPPFSGQLSGTIDWTGAPAMDLAIQLDCPELAAAGAAIPALDKLQAGGGASLKMSAKGPVAAMQRQAALELRNVSVPTHGVVADISRLNGTLLLEGSTVRSEKLTARIGKSPVILQARISDLNAPRLELGVKAAAVRADELIFHSDRTMLRDISGQLVIDRDGIAFAPVSVRLDGGTRATVRGSVRDFANPRVDLEIAGDYANVAEIIGLWTEESADAEKARLARYATGSHKPLPPIRIAVDARAGDLYGMAFANAKALIEPTSERLLIHPLDFNIDKGYCTAQVLVDFTASPALLRVSGHVEDVDAYQVYNELLDRKSIMRGTLRGDFYLQGRLGQGRFLPTSFGNFNVAVKDGVMRHSPVLGTVFSLLNVSQLFAMRLPDVSSEGVPFSLLTAEARLDKGILRSEQVVIDSEAMSMSYVGQLDMVRDDLDLLIVVKPLGTIDKVVSNLPIAGWILGGKERALITAQFKVTGPPENPKVEAIPISALSKGILGIFQRTLSLPLKLVEDPAILWGGGGEKE